MTLARRFAVAAAVMLVSGCSDSVMPEDNFPTFTGTWAGKNWVGDATAFVRPGGVAGDTLYVTAVNPVNAGQFPREVLSVKVVLHGTGAYPLGPNAARLDELIGGDVVGASYATTATTTGTLTLTHYSGVNGMAEGKIEFEGVSSSPYGSYGPKAAMTNAYFSAAVHSALQD